MVPVRLSDSVVAVPDGWEVAAILRCMARVDLSVDYGSSNTVAAIRGTDGRSRLLLFDSSPLLPSGVYVDVDGSLVGGQEARHLARLRPERYEPSPKRRIDAGELWLGDRAYPVVEVVATTLRLVAAAATEAAGAVPESVTLTHPAGWAATRRAVLVEAAARAGWLAPALVSEPVAAARYFRSLPDCPTGPLVVYDLGGGTCDVSVVAAAGPTVLAVDGIDDLGGSDLDALVVAMVREAIPPSQADAWRTITTPTTGPDRRHFRMLWDDARSAKELLSRRAGTHLHLPSLGIDVPIGREQFERIAAPLLTRSARLTAALVSRAGLASSDLAGIVLVGGASRTPLAATLLHQTVGVAPSVLDQPELAVAQGGLMPVEHPQPVARYSAKAGASPIRARAAVTVAPPPTLPAPDERLVMNQARIDAAPPPGETRDQTASRGRTRIWPLAWAAVLMLLALAWANGAIGQTVTPIAALAALGVGSYASLDTARRAHPGSRLTWIGRAGTVLLAGAVIATPIPYMTLVDGGASSGFAAPLPLLLVCAAVVVLLICATVVVLLVRRGRPRRTWLPVATVGTTALYGATMTAVFTLVSWYTSDSSGLHALAIWIRTTGMITALLATVGLILAGSRRRPYHP